MNKQLLQGHLQSLLTDCESQELSLRQTQDISWDAYDIGNWASMVQSILEIAKELNIELAVEEYQDEQ
ncbi:MAG: hypothetical protein RJA83_341 [Pseudomonadota bacterium]|jgi:hypothetical protein